jgi:hypothetical protein
VVERILGEEHLGAQAIRLRLLLLKEIMVVLARQVETLVLVEAVVQEPLALTARQLLVEKVEMVLHLP